MEFSDVTLSDLPAIVSQLWYSFEKYPIWLFEAEMGAGKTTLIKELCRYLEVAGDMVSSPTYSIANEYASKYGTLYHLDLYRLRNLSEAYQIGIEEYLYAPNVHCFIEWPDLIMPIVPKKEAVKISIIRKKSRRIVKADFFANI